MTRRLRPRAYVAVAVALAAVGILLAGSSAFSASSSSSAGVPASALKGKKVAFVACSDLNRWCRAFRKVIVGGLKAKGVVVTDLQDPYDPVLQAQHVQQAVAQHPDLIALLATNAQSVIPALRQAKAAGIPVVNMVGPTVPQSKAYYLASIENNHHMLGRYAAMNLVEGLQKEGLKKANIIVVTGAQVQPEVVIRIAGFKQYLAKFPQFKIVEMQDGNWDQGKSATIARTLFAKYRNKGGIQGAWGMADQQAAGIIQAAQQAGLPVGVAKKGLIVVGSNCFKIGMDNIAKGLEYGTATQAPAPTGQFILPYLEKVLVGQKIPKRILVKEARVTKANLGEWRGFCSAA
jgi:ABC-type sugar transport system substrate-binding protein